MKIFRSVKHWKTEARNARPRPPKIQLSDHFTYRKLLKFTLPSIAMMIFMSIYGVVDGFFVSNYVGKTPFVAINFIYPFLMILGSFGFMFGTGGSALISKTMGEGKKEHANQLFSMLVYITIAVGAVVGGLGILVLRPTAILLGATGELLENCVLYGTILLCGLPAFMLQFAFQSFFPTAEKPQLGLTVTIAAGVTNMVLDALFVAVWEWGLVGAAVATVSSQIIGGVTPLLYFLRKNNSSLLRLGRTKFYAREFFQACGNGFSELLSNISMSLVSMLYNAQLMAYAGENGVAAYGVLMYVCMIFLSAFIGYSIGTAPIVGFHYGAENDTELRNIFQKGLVIIGIFSVAMVVLAEALAYPLALLFVGYSEELIALTLRAFRIFSFSFLFSGIGIYGSSFFTALNNGFLSALLSALRTLGFQVASVFLLPLVMGVDGIWFSLILAEFLAAILTIILLFVNRKRYRYGG